MTRRFLIQVFIFFLFISIKAQINSGDASGVNSNLLMLQQISVTIGGEFIVNGTFPASSSERLDQFITRIYTTSKATMLSGIRDENSMLKFQKKYEQFALRNILLKHLNGEDEILDLAKFRLNGDFNNNPYLKEGDVIIFSTLDLETNFISISGAVNKPTEFQFVEGDDFQTALFFARGINRSFKNVNKVTISRLTNNGSNESIIELETDSNIKLQSGDRIRVLYEERNNYDLKVLVLGEVKQPGYVPISKNLTTINDVINKVGGFNENASLKFSELIRDKDSYSVLRNAALTKAYDNETILELTERLSGEKLIDFLRMYRTANLELGDTLFFGIDNQLKSLSGFTQVDFRNLEIDSSFESNYTVRDGDVIVIPEKVNEVYVWGGVGKIGYYPYSKIKTAWDYIDDAKGLTEIAYGKDEVYLIKGKSRNWLNVSENEKITIEAGDYIYVKKEVPKNFSFYLGRVSSYASIIGGIATVVLLMTQIIK